MMQCICNLISVCMSACNSLKCTVGNLACMHAMYAVMTPVRLPDIDRSSVMHDQALKGAKSSYMNMLLLLLRLRQACNHPW